MWEAHLDAKVHGFATVFDDAIAFRLRLTCWLSGLLIKLIN